MATSDPKDAAGEQSEEVSEVDAVPVEDDDLPGADAGAALAGAGRVIVAGGVDDGEARQEGLEIQPEAALGAGLPPPATGGACPNPNTRRRAEWWWSRPMNDALEATGQAFEASRASKAQSVPAALAA